MRIDVTINKIVLRETIANISWYDVYLNCNGVALKSIQQYSKRTIQEAYDLTDFDFRRLMRVKLKC